LATTNGGPEARIHVEEALLWSTKLAGHASQVQLTRDHILVEYGDLDSDNAIHCFGRDGRPR